MSVETPLKAYLAYRPEPLTLKKGVWVRDDNAPDLPERPPQFTPMTGTYADVAKRAVALNQAQMQAGFQHYLFWSETEENPDKPKPRCVFCGHGTFDLATKKCNGCDRISDVKEWFV